MRHKTLTDIERVHMRILREDGYTYESIAKIMKRSISVVWRELCGIRGAW